MAPTATNGQTGEMPPSGITTVLPITKSWLAVTQP